MGVALMEISFWKRSGLILKILFLILALSIVVAAQAPTLAKPKPTPPLAEPPCGLMLAQSPAWGPIKLGMTETEFQKIFPRMPFMVNKLDLPDTPAFANVDNMMFTFYRERLEDMTVQFDLSVHWDNVTQFTDSLSDTLKLPKVWTFTLDTGMLECKEFRMRAVSSRNEIKLRDTAASKRMEAENPTAAPPTTTKDISILPGSKPKPSPHP